MHVRKSTNPLLIFVILLLIVVLVLLVVLLVIKPGKEAGQSNTENSETVDLQEGNRPRIGYAEGLTIVEDPDALQKAVDDLYKKAEEPGVGLEYKNDAFSSNGIDFDCYIANSLNNGYDMYINIFADATLEDELYLSGLVRPGQAFDHLTLNHALESGTHRVYVAFTQVDEQDGEQSIHSQVFYTMDFHVE